MPLDLAPFVREAGVLSSAGVHALSIDAGLLDRALVIPTATDG